VLFLDELPEFSRRALETLRQPLEQGIVHIARASRSASFPASVMLVAAMNPCPCGFAGSTQRTCRCPPGAADRYARRVSGPMRERFDLALDVPAVTWSEMRSKTRSEGSAAVRSRVIAARTRQFTRQGRLNGRLDGRDLDRTCRLADRDADALLSAAVTRFGLSARAVTRVFRVARTIADLAGVPELGPAHLAEALHFRLEAPVA